jgi:TRAP transporter 4TM/12TM fusion protein
MTVCFLLTARKFEEQDFRKWFNITLAILTLVCGAYVFQEGISMPMRAGSPSITDLIIGTLFIILAIEATRRTTGTAMACIAIFFLIYTRFGQYFPGFLKHAPYSFLQIINNQFLEMSGLWGIPLGMAATFIIIFIIFGELLNEAGITEVFMELANKLIGKTIGATAKATTIISVLVGSITGSAAASVMVTGSMTIPGMRKTGYKPEFIAAVQAIGGTGGQVMPPIMGSAAFIIAAFLGIPYIAVCKAAIIPALLFYFCLFMVVHFRSKLVGINVLTQKEIDELTWTKVLKKGYLLLPIIVLTILLFKGYSPMLAGFISTILIFILSYINKDKRFTIQKLLRSFEKSVTSALSVTMSCAAAGIIIGCIMQSGLGYTISASLVRISGGQPFILAFLVLIACLILGMGMTTVGAYIIVASLVSPALIQAGIEPIAAHLFPFYYAILSAITPPVAVASYAAAGLTSTNPWRVGLQAFYLSLPIFIVPFIFFSQPELLLIGEPLKIITVTISSFLGAISFVAGLVGYLIGRLARWQRIFLVIAAVLLFSPNIYLKIMGLVFVLVIYFMRKKISGTRHFNKKRKDDRT